MTTHLFVACSTLGRGGIPVLPVELRELIVRMCRQDDAARPFVSLRCASCDGVVGYASTNASYDDLLRLSHTCLGCFQSSRTLPP